MKLEIADIIDRGIPNKERLWLRVKADADLIYYAVLATEYLAEHAISSVPRHVYWFVKKDVKAGDYVVLYTGKGTASETSNQAGGKTYFLFWGLGTTIWNKAADCAVLYEINSWETSKYQR